MDAHPMRSSVACLLAGILMFLSLPGVAAPYNYQVIQRNATDNGTPIRYLPNPVSPGVVYFDTTDNQIKYATLGGGLSVLGGVLSAAQVSADWSAASGPSAILNKPLLAPVATSGAFSDLYGRPTTLAGYGITDAYPLGSNPAGYLASINSAQITTALGYTPYSATNPNGYITPSALSGYATTSALADGLSGKYDKPAGTSSQYVRGDGSLASLPAQRRVTVYEGMTDASGLYTVTYSAPYSVTPSVQPEPPLASNQTWVKVSSTPTGFTLRLQQRASVSLLSVEVLLAATTNVSGGPAVVTVIEK